MVCACAQGYTWAPPAVCLSYNCHSIVTVGPSALEQLYACVCLSASLLCVLHGTLMESTPSCLLVTWADPHPSLSFTPLYTPPSSSNLVHASLFPPRAFGLEVVVHVEACVHTTLSGSGRRRSVLHAAVMLHQIRRRQINERKYW